MYSSNNNIDKDEKEISKDEKPTGKGKSSDEVQKTDVEKVNGKKSKNEKDKADVEIEEVNHLILRFCHICLSQAASFNKTHILKF